MSFRQHPSVYVAAFLLGATVSFSPASAFSGAGDKGSLQLDASPVTEFESEGRSASVEIVASETTMTPGSEFRIVISLTNRGERPLPVFNPGMGGPNRHAALGLFDANGHYAADLFDPPGSWLIRRDFIRLPRHDDWCVIAPKKTYVSRRSFKIDRTFDCESELLRMEPAYGLKPGRYQVQLIADRRLFSESPWEKPYYPCGMDKGSRDYAELQFQQQRRAAENPNPPAKRSELFRKWAKAYPAGELIRSNVVAITLISAPVEAPHP